MRVISLKPLRAFWERHADAEEPLRLWYKVAGGAEWSSLQDVRQAYPHADGVRTASGDTLTVFNVGGNKYRLIARIRYEYRLVSRSGRPHAPGVRRGEVEGVAMPATKRLDGKRLPARFADLVRLMPPQALIDEVQYENTVEMIDGLMAAGRLTRGQELYLETLVQLVEVYEAGRHAIETADIHGIDLLKHLLAENAMNASDLARLLGVHASMGSKILKGDRSLTVEHIRTLAERFKVGPQVFLG